MGYYDMTDDELAAWGTAENAARKADMEGMASATDLAVAQEKAKARRKLVGLTAGQALRAIKLAQRAGR